MDRRGFLAAASAPAIVKAGSLMRINPAIVAVRLGPVLTIDMITRECLRVLESQMTMTWNMERKYMADWTAQCANMQRLA